MGYVLVLLAALAVAAQGALNAHSNLRSLHHHGKRGSSSSCDSPAAARPNIMLVLLDDVGKASIPFTARRTPLPPGTPFFEAQFPDYMPNVMQESTRSMILERLYTAPECTVSRQALLSGRLPIHNGVIMREPMRWDGGIDRNSGYDGLNSNITTFVHHLKKLGYKTHMSGKADGFGQATYFHTPIGRGFDTALTYFNHANDMWNYTIGLPSYGYPPPCLGDEYPGGKYYQDLFWNNGSAKASPRYNGNCTGPQGSTCTYEEQLVSQRIIDVINDHNPAEGPFFAYYSSHVAHTPLQTPPGYTDFILSHCGPNATNSTWRNTCNVAERYTYLASLKYFDERFGAVISALKARNLYDNTLIVFHSDNGAPIGQGTGGNSFPLRGGKTTDWEGGLLVPAFIGGGFLPHHMRNTSYSRPISISDWYATFCELGGGTNCTGWHADPTGVRVPGIVPVESVPLWAFLNGSRTDAPHPVMAPTPTCLVVDSGDKIWKLVTAIQQQAITTGPSYPNCTACQNSCTLVAPNCNPQNSTNAPCTACNLLDRTAPCCNDGQRPTSGNPFSTTIQLPRYCNDGCMFELQSDPTESNDLCAAQPQLCVSLQSMLYTWNLTYYEPFRGCPLPSLYCQAARDAFNGTYGPFLNVDGCSSCVHVTDSYLAAPAYKQAHNFCNCYTDFASCNATLTTSQRCEWNFQTQTCNLPGGFSWHQWLVARRWNPAYYDASDYEGLPEFLSG